MIPQVLNGKEGIWSDVPTMKYFGYTIATSIGCEQALRTEKEYSKEKEKLRKEADDAKTKIWVDYTNLQTSSNNERLLFKDEVQKLNLKVEKQKTNNAKTIIISIITTGVAFLIGKSL